jgi:transcriptional regulator with XRE-family HTH domain
VSDDPIIVEAMPSVPTPIDEIARQQIRQWLRSTGTTQVSFADQIGRNQEWVSRYLNGNFDADLTTLQTMAGVFGHNLATLFGNLPSEPDESLLLRMFRGLRPEGRKALLTMLQEWTRARSADRSRTKMRY